MILGGSGMILGGSVGELGRTGRDEGVLGSTGGSTGRSTGRSTGGGIKGRQCEEVQGTGSTGEGTWTSKKEPGMEMRTTGRS